MRVEPSGPVPCPLAIFGEAPGHDEQIVGLPFVGKAGRELWAGLKRFCNLERDDFYVSNIVKYGLPKNRDPKPAEIAEALPEFLYELERVKPKIIVTAGGFSTRALLGDVKMADVHGIPHTAEVCGHSYTVLPIYHPAAGLHSKGFLAAFAYDLKRLAGFRKGEVKVWAPSPLPTVTSWLSEASRRACGCFRARTVVGLDTEGWARSLWGLSFNPDGEHGYVIRSDDKKALAWFARWIVNKVVVMHNGIHDLPVLRAMGIHIEKFHDTQVLEYHAMIRTGCGALEQEAQNLGTLAYRNLGMRLGGLKDIPGVDFDTRTIPYSDEVMEYAGLDAIATRRLFDVYEQYGFTKDQPYQIDMGQVPLVEQMIATGIPFDVDAALDYYAEVLEKLEGVTVELRHKAARLGNRDFNPGSHPQVRDLVTKLIGLRVRKRTRGGKASTNEKALAEHRDHPFVSKLQEFRELQKLRGTYLVPLLEELI